MVRRCRLFLDPACMCPYIDACVTAMRINVDSGYVRKCTSDGTSGLFRGISLTRVIKGYGLNTVPVRTRLEQTLFFVVLTAAGRSTIHVCELCRTWRFCPPGSVCVWGALPHARPLDT